MRTRPFGLVFVLLLALAGRGEAAMLATTGSLYLNTEPGSYVGGRLGEVLWTHGIEGIFSVDTNFDKGVTVRFDDGHYWSLDFAAPTYDPATNTNNGNRLAVGFYDHATRFPFNSPTRPGLSFDGDGRGNNTLGAWFNVLDIAYGTNGQILRFAADFRQYDESENMTGPSTYGSLRINSSIPVNPVPLPAPLLLLVSGLMSLVAVTKRCIASAPT